MGKVSALDTVGEEQATCRVDIDKTEKQDIALPGVAERCPVSEDRALLKTRMYQINLQFINPSTGKAQQGRLYVDPSEPLHKITKFARQLDDSIEVAAGGAEVDLVDLDPESQSCCLGCPSGCSFGCPSGCPSSRSPRCRRYTCGAVLVRFSASRGRSRALRSESTREELR